MLKVGLVGVGAISGSHIPTWLNNENTQLVAICDIREEQMEQYTEIKHYSSYDEMLENEELDIVDICVPTFLHVEFSLKALKKGINVLCEKPVSLKNDDATMLYEVAKQNNVKFMVAQVLRFWNEYVVLKELYENKKYGKLLSGSMIRLSARPKWSWDNWYTDEKRSGLVPFDLHIHDIDFMVFAFGKPKNVTSYRSNTPTQDYINAVYNFGDFSICSEASWYASPYPFKAEFRFQFEKAVVANEDGAFKIYEADGEIIDYSAKSECEASDISIPKSNGYQNEIEYFIDCVLNNKQAETVKPDELETVIEILNNL